MKNLRIIESCLVNGQHAEAGTELEGVDNALAADLVVSGRAVELKAEHEVRSPKVVNRDEEPANRDPQTSKPKVERPSPSRG